MTDKTNKEMKREYKELYLQVREIVNSYDPMGLVPPAPEDEYDSEVAKIMALLGKAKSVDELSFGVRSIFDEFFGRDEGLQSTLFLKLAKEIWEAKYGGARND